MRRTVGGAAAVARSAAAVRGRPTEDVVMRLVTALAHLFPEVGRSVAPAYVLSAKQR